ncbi:hypothetical protein [Xylella fastidiosa]|uniref:hypothetical protein n=1 Tax=Xylella fastidiosa TaxID=2371 RepID=UPI001E60B76F|nr:hypothetical protein [Xylella fastidiosa]
MPPSIDDPNLGPVWFFTTPLNTKTGDEPLQLGFEGTRIKGDSDPPIRILGVQISGFKCQDNGFSRTCQPSDALHAFHCFKDGFVLPMIQRGNGIFQTLELGSPGV